MPMRPTELIAQSVSSGWGPPASFGNRGGRSTCLRQRTRHCSCGTHQGNFEGIPATGEPIGFRGTTVARIENGKMVDESLPLRRWVR